MSESTDREQEILYWWSQAKDSMESAGKEKKFGAYFFALNRVYYAAFYGVSSILLGLGQPLSSHQDIQAAFYEMLIKTGKLDGSWGNFYDSLLADFLERDDQKLDQFDQAYLDKSIARCRQFLRELAPLAQVELPVDS